MTDKIYDLDGWLHDTTGPTRGLRIPLADFLQPEWTRHRGGIIPDVSVRQGQVRARIDFGRWVVDCPNRITCGGAIMASIKEPYAICPECGSPENGGKWYDVVFPSVAQRRAIEAMLILRPAFDRPLNARHRNWDGESLLGLARENREHGLPVR